MASTAFSGSSLYHQRAATTQIFVCLGHGTALLLMGSRLCTTCGGWERGKGAQANAPGQEHSQRDMTGVEAQCCHPCPDAAFSSQQLPKTLFDHTEETWKPLVQRTASSPPRITEMSAQAALKLPSHAPPPAASAVLGAALTRWTFSLLTRSGSGVASLLFLSRITGVPKTFRCHKKRGLLASA